MGFIYNNAKSLILAGDLDFANADLRIALLMTNTTADTEDNADTISDFTTLDEFDGANYVSMASGGKQLASKTISTNTTDDRSEFDASDVTYTALGIGTRSIVGILLYKFVDGTQANDIPVGWTYFATPQTPDSGDFIITWNTAGLFHAKN